MENLEKEMGRAQRYNFVRILALRNFSINSANGLIQGLKPSFRVAAACSIRACKTHLLHFQSHLKP